MILRLAFFSILVSCLCFQAAFADETPQDCKKQIADYGFPYFRIERYMADFKAAVDAGYEGCRTIYPEQFEGTEEWFAYWTRYTGEELAKAGDVVGYLLENPDKKQLGDACRNDADALTAVKENFGAAAERQYKKAFDRRLRVILAGKETAGAAFAPDYDGNNSCKWVHFSLEKYFEGREKRKALEYVLFTLTQDHSAINEDTSREQKRAFREFEKVRQQLAKDD